MFAGMTEPVKVALITVMAGLAGGIISQLAALAIARLNQKGAKTKTDAEAGKIRVDAADQIGEAALALLKPYQEEVTNLRCELSEMRTRLGQMDRRIASLEDELRAERQEKDSILAGAHRLYHQLVSLSITPVWYPPDRRGTNREDNNNGSI